MIQQYIIAGWGSLANYLTFLPTNAGFFPPPVVVGVSEHEATLAHAEPAKHVDFWDVLRPLTEKDEEKRSS